MKKIYLTFDIESIVTGLGYNSNMLGGVYLGAMYLARMLKERNLKGTFFISLSSKMSDYRYEDYKCITDWLIDSLKGYDNIKVAPHMHALDISMPFPCKSDRWCNYSKEEQVALLQNAKVYFQAKGIDASMFRPGGFQSNDSYYNALKEAGYSFSSILDLKGDAQINLVTGVTHNLMPFQVNGITEYPVSSVRIKSIKGKEETLNLSPDFFTLESVKSYIEELDYLNMNFHSFSIFLNRPIRENFSHIFARNGRFVLFDFPLVKLMRLLGYDSLRNNTIHRKELEKWLNFIVENNYQTYFIGE